jgi:Skp family chaperone for outer membrane proteins
MRSLALLLLTVIFLASAVAQTPVVPAAAPVVAPVAQAAPAAASASSQAALQLLQAMKAANEETLKKQEATLQQLDELQKAADQIKIFGKRG